MGKHSGTPVEEAPRPPQRQRLALLAAGVTATVVAWGFLVVKAVQFGSDARGGESVAWFFTFLATVGATACMFVTMILGTKAVAILRGDEPAPPGPGGGRRAAR